MTVMTAMVQQQLVTRIAELVVHLTMCQILLKKRSPVTGQIEDTNCARSSQWRIQSSFDLMAVFGCVNNTRYIWKLFISCTKESSSSTDEILISCVRDGIMISHQCCLSRPWRKSFSLQWSGLHLWLPMQLSLDLLPNDDCRLLLTSPVVISTYKNPLKSNVYPLIALITF